jgi:copper chaperone CopZ
MTKTYYISDMKCPSCVKLLEGLEDQLLGVKRIKANLKKQTLTVQFDAQVIAEKHITAAIHQLGYTPHPV